ncbi:ATP-binding protein [Massilia aurea]|uniref:ATP-binding protein n=1 Tax=Massilia aurea TaxID=373040 RepID=UPI0034617F8A
MEDALSKPKLYIAQAALTWIAIGTAALSVLGYLLAEDRLFAPFPGWQGVSILTALGLFCLAAPRWRGAPPAQARLPAILAVATLLLASVILLSHFIYLADIVSPWFAYTLLDLPENLSGRTSIATALSLAALSCAVLATRSGSSRAVTIIETTSNAALLLGGTALLGYMYRISDLYGVYLFNTMSLQTALSVTSLAIAFLIAEPATRLGMTLRSPFIGVAQSRRLLALTALPVVLGWVLVHHVFADSAGIGAALAILVIATCVPMVYLVLENARTADQLAREQIAQRDNEGQLALRMHRQLAEQSNELARHHRVQVESLATAERAKRYEVIAQLTGTIAHDFNNLLMVIGGSAQLLKLRMRGEPATAPLVDKIASTVMGAARLTAQLAAFSRTQRLQTEPVHLDTVVRAALAELHEHLPSQLNLVLALNAGTGTVLSDPGQLQLAFVHLIRNAVEATPQYGTVKITTALHGAAGDSGHVTVHVIDNGSGMSVETLDSALEPFFTTKKGQHPGLGLAQVNSVVQQASGTLHLTSSPQAGTTVELCMPCTATERRGATRPGQSLAPAKAAGNKRLLVIDDDDEVRAVIVELLRHMDYDVSEASDGEHGLDLLDKVDPALAIIDYLMPGMNGAEVARKARQRAPGLPIIFISGYADSSAIDLIPHSRLLRKPVVLTELEQTVSRALVD